MLNIGDLPVTGIKIVMNGYNDYEIHLMIVPSEHKSRWTQLKDGESCGCRSYGGYISGNPISFFSVKDAVRFIREEYGRYGLSLLVDEDFNKVDVSKALKEE